MGVVGTSADNALAESMGATLEREVLMDARSWSDELTCRHQIFRWLVPRTTPCAATPTAATCPNHLREADLTTTLATAA